MKRLLLGLSLLFAAIPACATEDSTAAHEAVAAGARLIDVRTPEEFAGGHLEGAINIPFDQVAERISEVGPADTAVVVYCQSGGRSGVAAQVLREAGFAKVIDIGPMHAW